MNYWTSISFLIIIKLGGALEGCSYRGTPVEKNCPTLSKEFTFIMKEKSRGSVGVARGTPPLQQLLLTFCPRVSTGLVFNNAALDLNYKNPLFTQS